MNNLSVGQVFDHYDFSSKLWPNDGPYILIEPIINTKTWAALNVQSSAIEHIIPSDELIYKRIA
jgi:hypothetical protein